MSRVQIERVLLIDRLIRDHRYPNAETLAAEWDVSRRVIFHDRKFLIERLGAPLEFDRVRRGWYYTEPTWVLPSTMVTEGELLAFFLSHEVAQRNLGGALGEALRSAVGKLTQSLQGQVAVDMDSLGQHYSFSEPAHRATDPGVLSALHHGIASQRIVEITYFTASTGTRKARLIHPHHLYHAHADWYLAAFDVERGEMRNFHVGRIEALRVTEKTFTRRPDFDGPQWVNASFVTETDGRIHDVTVRFDEYQARYIRERRIHETQTLEEQPDGGVILKFQSSGLAEIRRWVMQYGAHAEVLGPPELRDSVRTEVRRMNEIYGGEE